MNTRSSPFGPVTIIPAAALRNNQNLLGRLNAQELRTNQHQLNRLNGQVLRTDQHQLSRSHGQEIPINLSSYLGAPQSSPPLSATNSAPLYPPSWTPYRTRSYTTTSIFNEPVRGVPNYVKAVSGPVKYPEPLYRKRAYYRSRSADWVNPWTPTMSSPAPQMAVVTDSPVRMLGGTYRNYPASYVTYPPSTLYGTGKESIKKEKIGLRLALKIAQLVVGAIVIGTVAGPARGESFALFCARNRSGGQLYVLIIAIICLIVTAALSLTLCLAKRWQIWRNVDGVFNAIAAFLYLVAGCVESWYANCYPPFGNAHPEACGLVAWAIAAIFAFVNLVLYTIDFVLAAQAGIDFSL